MSGALRERQVVTLSERPRLADWGLYAAALYQAQGWGIDTFLSDWQGVEEAQQQGTLDGSSVAQAIILYMQNKTRIEKPASKLHTLIETFVEDELDLKNDRGWPKTGRTLWKRIREVTPLLETHGIRATRGASNKVGRPIILEKISHDPGDGDDTSRGDDKGDDNRPGDDKGDDSFGTSSPENPHSHAAGDDNSSGGRYFGGTNSSDRKEENQRGESNPDLSSPSSPGGAAREVW